MSNKSEACAAGAGDTTTSENAEVEDLEPSVLGTKDQLVRIF